MPSKICEYHLEFALSDQQRYASQQIVNAIKARRKLLLYVISVLPAPVTAYNNNFRRALIAFTIC
jgi:hypothetical protein